MDPISFSHGLDWCYPEQTARPVPLDFLVIRTNAENNLAPVVFFCTILPPSFMGAAFSPLFGAMVFCKEMRGRRKIIICIWEIFEMAVA